MIELKENIWEAQGPLDYVTVLTNGTVRKDGQLVMGAGIALEAKKRFPWMPKALGEAIRRNGLKIEIFQQSRIIAFPTKYEVFNPYSSIGLIEKSLVELLATIKHWSANPDYLPGFVAGGRILIPRPGCGLGGLHWENQVKPLLHHYLIDDRFVIYSFAEESKN